MLIPYGRQDISEQDIEAVVDVLQSDFLTQGELVPKFEAAIANYCHVNHAVAVTNATSALHMACLALDLGPGDTVWTSPITFVASANCALFCGANIDFVDIDPVTYNLCAETLSRKLEQAERSGNLPAIVIPVHFGGQSCDMAKIGELSKRYGFKVIEDASHALGGTFQDQPIGSSAYSDITVFSFHPVKMITTGEGGIAVTQDIELAHRMQSIRSHGITNIESEMLARPGNEIWNYQQIQLGYNFRMTDIQAALGLSQLTRLDDFVRNRRRIADRYDEELKSLPLHLPGKNLACESSYHLYVVRLDVNNTTKSQSEVFKAMRQNGVMVNLHYIPVYRQPYYENLGFSSGYCPEAESYFQEALTLPIYPSMTDIQQSRIVSILTDILSN